MKFPALRPDKNLQGWKRVRGLPRQRAQRVKARGQRLGRPARHPHVAIGSVLRGPHRTGEVDPALEETIK
jgi:hypothetical protein